MEPHGKVILFLYIYVHRIFMVHHLLRLVYECVAYQYTKNMNMYFTSNFPLCNQRLQYLTCYFRQLQLLFPA